MPNHVLVVGASGSGKEPVTRAIHRRSAFENKELILRNASAMPEGIADVELFGSAKNYPLAGMPERPGLIGAANRTTLYLDDFGEMPTQVQAHLLRVFDEGEYQRLGETKIHDVRFRLIAATNCPLSSLKHDVGARLQSKVNLPDLNQRRADIPLLIRYLLPRVYAAPALERGTREVSSVPEFIRTPELVRLFTCRNDTTNIRELGELLTVAVRERRGCYLGLTSGVRAAAVRFTTASPLKREASEAPSKLSAYIFSREE